MHDIIATRQIACLLHAPGQCVVNSYKFSQENTNFGAYMVACTCMWETQRTCHIIQCQVIN